MNRGIWSDDFGALPSLSVAAHELKAPIALIRQLGLLLDENNLSDSTRSEYVKQIVVTADRALRLTSDLTKVSNLQESLFPLEPVNPFAVCQEVSYETLPIEKVYGRKVSWPKSRKNVLIVANAQLLERIVSNFVHNSLRYTDPGVPIRVSISQSKSNARISVRDYGPQLSKQDYKKLINELEKLKTTRTRPDSSGLGVFMASQFAKVMQGGIGLIRHRDGVTFYVDMPLSRQMSWL